LPPLLLLLIGLALFFSLLNGFRDSSNIVATMISSRAFRPPVAMAVTAVAEFSGPFIFGVAVAKTIGNDLVAPGTINLLVIVVALATACLWSLFTWQLSVPSSSSHALVGGLVGATAVGAGLRAVQLAGLLKIVLALFAAPVIGLTVGYLLTRLVLLLARSATPGINRFFKCSQLVTAVALAFSHGTNDAQKSMGIITLGLVTSGYLSSFVVPLWVIVSCSGLIALGTALGDWRLIKTLGAKFYKIRPVDGFCAQLTSAIVILGASLLGGPVSTTQVVSSAIVGTGSAERLSRVRWGVVGEILLAWLLTIPATALAAAGLYWFVTQPLPAIIKLLG
jgi:inorganic phosphate transporter, PiT family